MPRAVLQPVSFTGDEWVDGFLFAEAARQRRFATLHINPWKPVALGERILLAAEAAGLQCEVRLHRMKGREGEWLRLDIRAPDNRFAPIVRKRDRRLPPDASKEFLYGLLEGLARRGHTVPRFALPPLAAEALERLGLPAQVDRGFVEAPELDERLEEALAWREGLDDLMKRIQWDEGDRLTAAWLASEGSPDYADQAAALIYRLSEAARQEPAWHETLDLDGLLVPVPVGGQKRLLQSALPKQTKGRPLSWRDAGLAPGWRRFVEGLAAAVQSDAKRDSEVRVLAGMSLSVRHRRQVAAVLGIELRSRTGLVVPAKDAWRLGRVLGWHGAVDAEAIKACLAAWVHLAVGPVCRGTRPGETPLDHAPA